MTRRNHYVTRSLFILAAICLLAPVARSQQPTSPEEERKQFRERSFEQSKEEFAAGVSRGAMQTFHAKAKETVELLTQVQQAVTDLTSKLAAIRTSDDGKRLATDPTAVHAIILIEEELPVSVDEVRAAKKNADMILGVASEVLAKADVGLTPTNAANEELWGLFHVAKYQRRIVLTDLSKVAGLIDKTPKNIDVTGLPTLSSVMDESQAKYMKFIGEAILQGKDLAKEPVKTIMVDAAQFAELQKAAARADRLKAEGLAQAETMRLDYELRIKKIKADEETRRLETEDEIKRLKEQADAERHTKNVESAGKATRQMDTAEHDRKKTLAQTTAVRELVKPFTTPGYHRWRAGDTMDRQPFSLQALQAAGALDPSTQGLNKLLDIGLDKGDKERPRFGYPGNWSKLNPGQKEELKAIQNHLIELGDVMVELGMLAP